MYIHTCIYTCIHIHMALGRLGSIYRNLAKKIQIGVPRKLLWTWAQFCMNIGMVLASFGSRSTDIFLCLWKYPGRAPTQETHGLDQASAETCKAVTSRANPSPSEPPTCQAETSRPESGQAEPGWAGLRRAISQPSQAKPSRDGSSRAGLSNFFFTVTCNSAAEVLQ